MFLTSGIIAAGGDPDDIVEDVIALKKLPGELRETEQDILKSRSDVRIAEAGAQGGRDAKTAETKLKVEQAKLAKANTQKVLSDLGIEGAKIPEKTLGYMRESSKEQVATKKQLTKASELLSQVKDIKGLGEGLVGKGKTWLKKALGSEGAAESFKKKLASITLKDMMSNKPPGPMTDKDFEILAQAVPGEDASSEAIKDYLGAVIRFATYDSKRHDFTQKFLAQNKYDAPVMKPFEVNGIMTKKGETLNNFIDRIGQRIYEEGAAQIPGLKIEGVEAIKMGKDKTESVKEGGVTYTINKGRGTPKPIVKTINLPDGRVQQITFPTKEQADAFMIDWEKPQ
jgi:hypothetical protein